MRIIKYILLEILLYRYVFPCCVAQPINGKITESSLLHLLFVKLNMYNIHYFVAFHTTSYITRTYK